ncbi:DUF2958 domain-containing protein [Marinivivus vitaminiproducens]|uniref:DUF2958 domain-containing protein n=1 Tax=Marinivivus vitaminiproducens TaxID=3035935 RepID=UPI0027A03507|nr:DUF2958 domain-containing protein [Geminicoccaceae bacterium SCSIO 64248]
MPKRLIPADRLDKPAENGRLRDHGIATLRPPVVKLYAPEAKAAWLLSEADPDDPDVFFGLRDDGLGCPYLGYVSVRVLRSTYDRVLYDPSFKAVHTLRRYECLARKHGHIVDT